MVQCRKRMWFHPQNDTRGRCVCAPDCHEEGKPRKSLPGAGEERLESEVGDGAEGAEAAEVTGPVRFRLEAGNGAIDHDSAGALQLHISPIIRFSHPARRNECETLAMSNERKTGD
ncbi:hypothetical protein H920_08169 [Fukomys damarensis]|uniref:Uncharacterized protein n=1 Tax=Fukomys damarensis TaxID=885580 RepID=A0A091DIX6_FUKDA|nr:hypothetical protein H920_08169 [Fukomys damarensis]